jgi:hypothetical protein
MVDDLVEGMIFGGCLQSRSGLAASQAEVVVRARQRTVVGVC